VSSKVRRKCARAHQQNAHGHTNRPSRASYAGDDNARCAASLTRERESVATQAVGGQGRRGDLASSAMYSGSSLADLGSAFILRFPRCQALVLHAHARPGQLCASLQPGKTCRRSPSLIKAQRTLDGAGHNVSRSERHRHLRPPRRDRAGRTRPEENDREARQRGNEETTRRGGLTTPPRCPASRCPPCRPRRRTLPAGPRGFRPRCRSLPFWPQRPVLLAAILLGWRHRRRRHSNP
jgi:hypothetical protein